MLRGVAKRHERLRYLLRPQRRGALPLRDFHSSLVLAMPVGLLTFELQLRYTHSLKEKRAVLQGLLTRLRTRFNIAVAELDHQDVWQRATVGVVSISTNQTLLESSLHQVLAESEKILGQDVANYTLEFF